MTDFILRRFDHGELTVMVRQYGEARPVEPARAFLLVHGIGASSRYFARLSKAPTMLGQALRLFRDEWTAPPSANWIAGPGR